MEQVQDIDTGSHYWFQAPLKTFSDKLVDFPWSNFALLNNIQLLKFFQGINLSLQFFFKTTILVWNDKVQHLNKFNISLIICAKVESSRTSMGWRHGFVKYIIFCIQNKQIIQNFPIICKKKLNYNEKYYKNVVCFQELLIIHEPTIKPYLICMRFHSAHFHMKPIREITRNFRE